MAESTDDLLGRAVPKLAQAGEEKLRSLRPKLARFAARAWTRGKGKLEQLGIVVRSSVHQAALDAAEASEDDDEGAFLDDVRKVMKDDEAFVKFLASLARAYSTALKKKKEAAGAKEDAADEELEVKPEEKPAAKPVSKRASSGRHKALGAEKARRSRSSRRAKVVDELEPEPARAPAPASAGSSDELPKLEIPDDEDEAPAAKPRGVRFDEEPAPAKKPEAPHGRKEKGEFRRVELDVPEEGDIQIEMMKTASPSEPAPAAAPVAEKDEGPEAAAARAIERYKKDGDAEELAQARKLFKAALEKAEPGPARAAARAGVALAHLLAGQDAEAKKHAAKALEEDACCALAISVAAKAGRSEGAREKLKAAIARVRLAIRSGNKGRVASEVAALEKEFPDEPFAALLSIAAAGESNQSYDDQVVAAWKRYPSTLAPDLALGPEVDVACSKAIATWGALEVEKGGSDALIKTQRNLDQKENVIAGAFQLAIGVARTALATRTDLSKTEQQELRAAAAEGLLGLQHYDAAAAAFDKVQTIDRQSHVAAVAKKGAERANVMRRAFDKPGVKAKGGSFEGLGVAALKKVVAARIAQAASERQKDEAALLEDEVKAVKALAGDATRRASVIKRARAGGSENPLQPLVDVEQQLEALSSSSKGLDDKKADAGKKGFFGRAFDKMKDTAKGAEIAVRQKILEGKRDEAYRAVARLLRDAPTGGWGDKVLDALAARGASVNARLDYLEDEINQANKVLAKLNDL